LREYWSGRRTALSSAVTRWKAIGMAPLLRILEYAVLIAIIAFALWVFTKIGETVMI